MMKYDYAYCVYSKWYKVSNTNDDLGKQRRKGTKSNDEEMRNSKKNISNSKNN